MKKLLLLAVVLAFMGCEATLSNRNQKQLKTGTKFYMNWGMDGKSLTRFEVLDTNSVGVHVKYIDFSIEEMQFIEFIDINRNKAFKVIKPDTLSISVYSISEIQTPIKK